MWVVPPIVKWYKIKRRKKPLKKLAELLNFTFSEKGDALASFLSGFYLFSQSYFPSISNVLSGRFNGIPVWIMDYKYTESVGRHPSTYQQTVLAFNSNKLQLPSFILRPTNLFDKIGIVLGDKDINFDIAPVFSKQYSLRGNNEEAIRRLFNDRALEYYERHPGLSTEGDGNKLIYYRFSKLVSPNKIQAFLQEGYDLFRIFNS